MKLLWLANVLRNAGLKVVEVPGWKTRGRDMGPIEGVILHHTASKSSGNMPSLDILMIGREDLFGPLSQLGLGRDGTYYVVAAGRANHAGVGSYPGIMSGNSRTIGIEAENRGLSNDPWPQVQLEAYAKGAAAILKHLGLPYTKVIGHKEWAPRRKIDPSFDMNKFRAKVKTLMEEKEPPIEVSVPPVKPSVEEPTTPIVAEPPAIVESEANKLKGFDRAFFAKEHLMELGWDDYQASALIAQAMVESTWDLKTGPSSVYLLNKKIVPADTPGAKPTGFGIMRWGAVRAAQLEEFANKNNRKVTDLEIQVKFVDWELHNTEKAAEKMLKESNNLMEALRAAIGYVKPPKWTAENPENGEGWKDRVIFAYSLMRI